MKTVQFNQKIAVIDGRIKTLQAQRAQLVWNRDNQPEPKKRPVPKSPSKKNEGKKKS